MIVYPLFLDLNNNTIKYKVKTYYNADEIYNLTFSVATYSENLAVNAFGNGFFAYCNQNSPYPNGGTIYVKKYDNSVNYSFTTVKAYMADDNPYPAYADAYADDEICIYRMGYRGSSGGPMYIYSKQDRTNTTLGSPNLYSESLIYSYRKNNIVTIIDNKNTVVKVDITAKTSSVSTATGVGISDYGKILSCMYFEDNAWFFCNSGLYQIQNNNTINLIASLPSSLKDSTIYYIFYDNNKFYINKLDEQGYYDLSTKKYIKQTSNYNRPSHSRGNYPNLPVVMVNNVNLSISGTYDRGISYKYDGGVSCSIFNKYQYYSVEINKNK